MQKIEQAEENIVSARVDRELWKEVKKTAIDRNMSVGELVTIALKKEIRR